MYSLSVISGIGTQGITSGFGGNRLPGVFDVNDKGEAVGRLLASSGNQFDLLAFSTTGSSNLGLSNSQAFGINNRDEVVGQSGGFGLAFRTTPGGQITDASTIEGNGIQGVIGFAINDNGDVVGLGRSDKGEQAFRQFENQPIENLGTLRTDGTGGSVAYSINRYGVTVGRAATNDNSQHAFRYGVDTDILSFGPKMFDLGTLGGKSSLARDINDYSLIVGESDITPDSNIRHAFVTLSTIDFSSDLGTLATNDRNANSRAFDINNKLQIVGESDTDIPGEKHAFLEDPFGGMVDLNDLISKSDNSAFVLTSASAINESGEIVGSALLKFDQPIRYESGRVIDGRAGNIYAFRLTPTATRLEAEDLTLNSYQVESNNAASGGKLISLLGASNNTGSASAEFKEVSGTYDIVVNYLDETDGRAQLGLNVNDRPIDSWTLDKNLGNANPVEQTLTKRIISGVRLRQGDTLSLVGIPDNGEWARVDSIEWVPVDHVLGLEAEDFNLGTYQIESNSAASGGRVISLRGASSNTGVASTQFTGQSGSYDIQISYLDETDGTAQINLKVNDQSVDAWVLDKNLGNADPIEQTFVDRVIPNVFLKEGDILSIAGTSDGGEWARVDSLRLVAASGVV